jgi:type I restriction enzyme, S subunit
LLREGDILMSLTGNIGRVIVVGKIKEPLLQNYRVGKFVHKRIDKGYLAYSLAFNSTTRQLEILSNQTSQANFGKQDFEKVKLSIPPTIEEQTHIARILSDMDAEIEALEKKLQKYKMIKQGMMHNLLTGKIRLV